MTDLTVQQRSNLKTLADYLDNMPEDYAKTHFLMAAYAVCLPNLAEDLNGYPNLRERYEDDDDADESDELIQKLKGQAPNSFYACGTCACAIGHGPAAGIAVTNADTNWDRYSLRAFGMAQFEGPQFSPTFQDWNYVFGPDNPDDPKAAASRIHAFLSR